MERRASSRRAMREASKLESSCDISFERARLQPSRKEIEECGFSR